MNSRHEMRHDLLWLTASGWQALMAQGPDLADLARWRDADRPLVVRRSEPGLPPGAISIGLPLPPAADGSKRRFGGHVQPDQVARRQRPLTLAQVAASAPPHWQRAIAALLADTPADPRAGAMADVMVDSPPLRCFGSLAMQAVTGLPYLTDASDLDLLLQPRSVAQLDAGLALLRRHRDHLPLDGEIVFPHGAAVSWKEWLAAPAGGDARLLVKSMDGVALVPRATLLASLHPAHAAEPADTADKLARPPAP